ncbi:adenosylcobinamide-phosphate synthase CbiB [Clostridium perfringens]|uniref:adenosylcobinamide-phosphate synthase CbiB n=1 Tax=Clostridium perfringens TaxID=1502 RepID=UPI0034A569B7
MIKIIIGYVLDLIIGDPNNPYHPIRYIGKLASNREKLWRKVFKKNLKIAGFFAWLFIVFITFGVTLGIVHIANKINPILGTIVSGILIYFCISAKGLKVEGLKVIKILKEGDIVKARKQLSYIVGRDTENLDEEAIVRAVVETVAENMSDGIIAPLLFAGIGGAPLAFLYKAVNTCDSMFGYKNDKYKDFGFFSAKLDDVFNYIPARLTAYLIVISSFILRLNCKDSFKIYKRDRYNHSSPNSAHPEAAVAGALGIRLGGANYYFGKLVEKPTIGDAKKKIEISDVYKTNNILGMVSFLGMVVALIIRCILEVII